MHVTAYHSLHARRTYHRIQRVLDGMLLKEKKTKHFEQMHETAYKRPKLQVLTISAMRVLSDK